MDSAVLAIVIAVVVLVVAAAAFVLVRRRAAPPPKPLSTSSADRTFVGIPTAPRSDATVVGPIPARSDATAAGPVPARSDATVVDVRASSPEPVPAPSPAPATPAPPAAAATAAAPSPSATVAEAPTVVLGSGAAGATMPTVRIPKLRARVTVVKGGSGTHELDAREYQIGRSAHADIILADPSVSGHHAKIAPHGDAFAVADLGSTNGTTVDGRSFQGEYVLRGGETIGIGDARLRYERLG